MNTVFHPRYLGLAARSLIIRFLLAFFALFALFALSIAQAQSTGELTPELPTVVVTASRLPQTLADTIANTTLISRSDIERSSAADLPSLLSQYAGIQFGRNGGVGQAANIFMRGTTPRSTLVLLDGVPVNDQNDGTARMELLPLDLIERVEIVRGNVSAEYGSNAVGGVIQIFSRQAHSAPSSGTPSAISSAGSLTAELGTQGQRKLSASTSLLAGATSVFAFASQSKTNGVSAEMPSQNASANPDKDGSRQTTGSLGLSHRFSSGLTLGLKAWSTQQRTQYDDDYNGTLSSDDTIRQRLTQITGSLDWQVNTLWQTQLKLSSQEQMARSQANQLPVNSNENQREFMAWQNNFNLDTWGTAMLGAEREGTQFKGESFGTYGYATPQHQRSTHALIAGWQGKIANLSWNVNTRRDRLIEEKATNAPSANAKAKQHSVNTYSVGAAYALTPSLSVLGSVANAFNRPTLGQIYDPYYGNLALTAEKAKNQELGLQWAQHNQLLKLTHHRSSTRDMFGFDPVSYQTINIDRVKNRGFELLAEMSMPWSGGKLRVNANAQNPINQTTGALLARRAQTQLSATAQGTLAAWSWDISANYMGKRSDTDYSVYPAAGVTLKSYTKFDASMAYAFSPKTSLGLYLSNISSVNDQSAYGYSGTPRGAMLRLHYKL